MHIHRARRRYARNAITANGGVHDTVQAISGGITKVNGSLGDSSVFSGSELMLTSPGGRLQALELMRLIDKNVIDAKFIKDQPVILLILSE
jgi:hypothetical protein